MTPETLVCAANIPPERLNALRDGALSASEAQQLRAHVATCAACQARLADYDRLAVALRAQRELEPGDRIINDLRARIANPGAARGSGWRLMQGPLGAARTRAALVAVAAVAVLILLFVGVFAQFKPRASEGNLNATATSLKGPTVTPSVVQVPTFTQPVDGSAIWGVGYTTHIAAVSFSPVNGAQFIPGAYTPDLGTIAGIVFDTPASGSATAQLALYDIASKTLTKLSPTWNGYGGRPWGSVLSVDSQYIIYGYNDQAGATGGVTHNTLWVYIRATGKRWQINAAPNGGGVLSDFVSNDHVVYQSADNNQVYVADVAAHSVQPALINDTSLKLLNFTWPYVMYSTSTSNTLYMQNLTNNQVTTIDAALSDDNNTPIDVSQVSDMMLLNDSLYVEVPIQLNGVDSHGATVNLAYTILFRLDTPFDSGIFARLAEWQNPQNQFSSSMAASGNLIWLGYGYFWDTGQSQLVSTDLTSAQLPGPFITTTNQSPQQYATASYALDTRNFIRP